CRAEAAAMRQMAASERRSRRRYRPRRAGRAEATRSSIPRKRGRRKDAAASPPLPHRRCLAQERATIALSPVTAIGGSGGERARPAWADRNTEQWGAVSGLRRDWPRDSRGPETRPPLSRLGPESAENPLVGATGIEPVTPTMSR